MHRSHAIIAVGILSAGGALLLCTVLGAVQIGRGLAAGLLLLATAAAGYSHFATARLASQDLHAELVARESWEAAAHGVPRLGELLVYRYHWVRKADLDRALATQKQTGRMLGEILLDMRVLSSMQLLRALREQRRMQHEGPLPAHEVNWAEPGEVQ